MQPMSTEPAFLSVFRPQGSLWILIHSTPLQSDMGSSVHLEVSWFLMVLHHPQFYSLTTAAASPPSLCTRSPPVLLHTNCSKTSPCLICVFTTTFAYYLSHNISFTSHRPLRVGVCPPTAPLLHAINQCTPPPTFLLPPFGPPPLMVSLRSFWPADLAASQGYNLITQHEIPLSPK